MLQQTIRWVRAGSKAKDPSDWGVFKRALYVSKDPFIKAFFIFILGVCLLLAAIGCFAAELIKGNNFVDSLNTPQFITTLVLGSIIMPSSLFVGGGGRLSGKLLKKPSNEMKGKLAVVTGANCGIGKETAKQLALWGCNVIMACRDVKKGETAAEEIREAMHKKNENCLLQHCNSVELLRLDLSDLESVKTFANELLSRDKDIDLLVNNAGLMFPPLTRSKQGYELQFATNHLGHYLLTRLIINRVANCQGRVINVSSFGHVLGPTLPLDSIMNVDEQSFDTYVFYGYSKTCNILFTRELTKRFEELARRDNVDSTAGGGAVSYCLHPGSVRTNLMRYETWIGYLRPFLKSPWQGAQTSLYLCAADKTKLAPGGYYADCHEMPVAPETDANSSDAQKALWELSEQLVKDYLSD